MSLNLGFIFNKIVTIIPTLQHPYEDSMCSVPGRGSVKNIEKLVGIVIIIIEYFH